MNPVVMPVDGMGGVPPVPPSPVATLLIIINNSFI